MIKFRNKHLTKGKFYLDVINENNACVCDEMCSNEDKGNEEEKCAYCWAKEVLKETRGD
jgi:hypothetical protein